MARLHILGVKEGDHTFVFTQVAEAEQAGRVTSYEREDRHQGMQHRLRLVCDMPLNASPGDVRVNCIACWETVGDTVQQGSWVTDLCVNTGTVYRIMQGARARWRIATEQPPAEAGGLVTRTESPDTGPRPVVRCLVPAARLRGVPTAAACGCEGSRVGVPAQVPASVKTVSPSSSDALASLGDTQEGEPAASQKRR